MRSRGTADFQPLRRLPIIASLCLGILSTSPLLAQPRERPTHTLSPNILLEDGPWLNGIHTINQLKLVVSNRGVLGKGTYWDIEERDLFTGNVFRDGLIFPRASRRSYLDYLDLWVGARGNMGPIVSVGATPWDWDWHEGEWLPSQPPGTMVRRSTTDRFGPPDSNAVSEEDLICDYGDSLRADRYWSGYLVHEAPNPEALGITVRQESYGWSMGYAEDFLILTMRIRNDSRKWLKDAYIGLHISTSAFLTRTYYDCEYPKRVVCGLRREADAAFGCGLTDTLDIMWHANASGGPVEGEWLEGLRYNVADECMWGSKRSVVGVMPLERPEVTGPFKYNWWGYMSMYVDSEWVDYSYEPSQSPSAPAVLNYYRQIDTDRDRYRLLSTDEIDYPNYYAGAVAAANRGDWNWVSPFIANEIAMGAWADELISWGPLGLPPGGEVPLTFALVGGEYLHVNPNNYFNLPHRPKLYEAGLDFSDLDKNALVARWIYDNPGIDTDDDGYFGEFRVCVRDSILVGDQWVAQKADTQWYKGDGIPDFRGALPPPAPYVWVTPVHNGLHVRFNGQVSETERDIFLQKPDFEGYRVYIGRDERVASLSVAASYDLEDYDKYRYNLSLEEPDWQLTDEPFSKDELRCLYGLTTDPCNDSTFDPLLFTQMSPYRHPMYPNDSLFWFKPHDYNASTYGISTPITKTYPDMPDPRLLPADSITEEMYTEDGYLKFYEYECTIENILSTVSYWVNVTAFDYGSPAMGVAPMESDKSKGIIEAFPLHELDQPLSGSDNIYVFPNPYRIDINYRELGLEGRNQDDRWDERVRAVWFANLPPVCTIHIYTLDGDRVRTIDHNVPASDPTSRRHAWDLINRNYQKVESGLYYWVVEIPGDKTQIGKLALIR